MLAGLAIVTSVLAALSDDDPVDFNEIFVRAFLLQNPQIFLDELIMVDPDVLDEAIDGIRTWMITSPSFDELVRRVEFGFPILRSILKWKGARDSDVDVQLSEEVVAADLAYVGLPRSNEEYARAINPKRRLPTFGGPPVCFLDESAFWERRSKRWSDNSILFRRLRTEQLHVYNGSFLRDEFDCDEHWTLSWDETRVFVEIGAMTSRTIPGIEYHVIERSRLGRYQLQTEDPPDEFDGEDE